MKGGQLKRFYEAVTFEETAGGFQISLDGRKVKTQGGRQQIVPTRRLAQMLAQEWQSQGDKIDPRTLPRRDLADLAIDQIAPDPEPTLAQLLDYAETDTLCYRADLDAPAYRQQHDLWEPLVRACEARENVVFKRVSGIIHSAQPAPTLAKLRVRLARENPFALAGVLTMAGLAASLIIALEALESRQDAGKLFVAANAEEDWQAALWGWDKDAKVRRAARREAFTLAADFAQAARN